MEVILMFLGGFIFSTVVILAILATAPRGDE